MRSLQRTCPVYQHSAVPQMKTPQAVMRSHTTPHFSFLRLSSSPYLFLPTLCWFWALKLLTRSGIWSLLQELYLLLYEWLRNIRLSSLRESILPLLMAAFEHLQCVNNWKVREPRQTRQWPVRQHSHRAGEEKRRVVHRGSLCPPYEKQPVWMCWSSIWLHVCTSLKGTQQRDSRDQGSHFSLDSFEIFISATAAINASARRKLNNMAFLA